MVDKKQISKSEDPSRALVKAIAMDIGKEVVSHAQNMYPDIFSSAPSTFVLTIRNGIYNQIMAALEVTEEGKIIARLQERKVFRRKINAMYKKIRTKKEIKND